MTDYNIGDVANFISSIRQQSTETPTNDLFSKKKKKKRSVENEAEIVANGKEAVESPDVKKKKKKKHSEEVVSEEPVSNTVTITAVTRNGVDEGSHKKKKKRKHGEDNVEEKPSQTAVTVVASNDTQGPQKKKKKKKHKENIEAKEEIEATVTVVTADSTQEPQKKKKKKKHKENIEADEEENKATVTVVTADSSDKPSAEKVGKKRNRKKKSGAVTSTEKGTDESGKSNISVNGVAKVKGNTLSSQDVEAIKMKKKKRKQERMQKKKLKRMEFNKLETAEKKNNKTDTNNIEHTLTLENKDKKDKSKKDLKQEKIKERKLKSLPTQHPDAEARTIFIGNVNMKTKRKELIKIFSKYGKIECVRIRGVAVAEQGMLKKVAHVKGQMHSSRSSVTAYVRFESTDSVTAALEANGMEFKDHHLNVDRAVNGPKREFKNSVFIGNLPWEAEDEQIYQHFKACGEIDSVRIIRDKELKSGKGFGYVNFKSSDATEVALQLAGKMFMNRPLRITRCTKKPKKDKVNVDNSTKKSNMKLDFMKKNNKQKTNYSQQTKEKTPSESEFSGAKTAELGKNKKIKKPRWNQEYRKMAAVSSLLTGDKSVVQRPKFTAKKGGGKPTGKPIAKKFGGKPGGNFGGKPGGKFGGKPGGKFGGKPFAGKPGAGK